MVAFFSRADVGALPGRHHAGVWWAARMRANAIFVSPARQGRGNI